MEARKKEQRELEQLKNLVARNTAMIENQQRYLRDRVFTLLTSQLYFLVPTFWCLETPVENYFEQLGYLLRI